MDRRTRARELAMQGIYQLDIQGSELLGQLAAFFNENEPDGLTRDLAKKWCRETWEHLKICDDLIVQSTIKWGMARLSYVDKSILRLSVYQLKFCHDIPPKVIINEAIELAKKFSTDRSSAFVNGVLDSVLKKLKEQENCGEADQQKKERDITSQ